MSRLITLRLNKGHDLQLTKMELEKSYFRVTRDSVTGGKIIQLRVYPISGNLKKGTNTDRLKIYTNQKSRELFEVPIRIDIL